MRGLRSCRKCYDAAPSFEKWSQDKDIAIAPPAAPTQPPASPMGSGLGRSRTDGAVPARSPPRSPLGSGRRMTADGVVRARSHTPTPPRARAADPPGSGNSMRYNDVDINLAHHSSLTSTSAVTTVPERGVYLRCSIFLAHWRTSGGGGGWRCGVSKLSKLSKLSKSGVRGGVARGPRALEQHWHVLLRKEEDGGGHRVYS